MDFILFLMEIRSRQKNGIGYFITPILLQSRVTNIRCLSSIAVSSVDYKRIDAYVELSNQRGRRVIIRNLNGRLSAYRNWITRGLKNRIGKRGGGLRSKTRISA